MNGNAIVGAFSIAFWLAFRAITIVGTNPTFATGFAVSSLSSGAVTICLPKLV